MPPGSCSNVTETNDESGDPNFPPPSMCIMNENVVGDLGGKEDFSFVENAERLLMPSSQITSLRGCKRVQTSPLHVYDDGEDEDASAVSGNKGRGRYGGLRQIAIRLCKLLQDQHEMAHEAVADQLAREFSSAAIKPSEQSQSEASIEAQKASAEKNVRRRVYDAINVLMALGIVVKEKKLIAWHGMPPMRGPSTPLESQQYEVAELRRRVEAKQKNLQDLVCKFNAYQSLIMRNADTERHPASQNRQQAECSPADRLEEPDCISLPFIVVKLGPAAAVSCESTEDLNQMRFIFSESFELYDDCEVLQHMGLHVVSEDPGVLPGTTTSS
eukprot:Rmarinus@m.10397